MVGDRGHRDECEAGGGRQPRPNTGAIKAKKEKGRSDRSKK